MVVDVGGEALFVAEADDALFGEVWGLPEGLYGDLIRLDQDPFVGVFPVEEEIDVPTSLGGVGTERRILQGALSESPCIFDHLEDPTIIPRGLLGADGFQGKEGLRQQKGHEE